MRTLVPPVSAQLRIAGRWTYLYRAIDSAGNTIDLLLSPYRDTLAAKSFLQFALAQAGRIQPRVINVGRARVKCGSAKGIRRISFDRLQGVNRLYIIFEPV